MRAFFVRLPARFAGGERRKGAGEPRGMDTAAELADGVGQLFTYRATVPSCLRGPLSEMTGND